MCAQYLERITERVTSEREIGQLSQVKIILGIRTTNCCQNGVYQAGFVWQEVPGGWGPGVSQCQICS